MEIDISEGCSDTISVKNYKFRVVVKKGNGFEGKYNFGSQPNKMKSALAGFSKAFNNAERDLRTFSMLDQMPLLDEGKCTEARRLLRNLSTNFLDCDDAKQIFYRPDKQVFKTIDPEAVVQLYEPINEKVKMQKEFYYKEGLGKRKKEERQEYVKSTHKREI